MKAVIEDPFNSIDRKLLDDVEVRTLDHIVYSQEKYFQTLSAEIDYLASLFIAPEGYSSESKLRQEIVRTIKDFGHAPAYIFVLGYDPLDVEQNEHIIGENYDHEVVGKNIKDGISELLDEIAYEDNAILVKAGGEIFAIDAYLNSVNPADIVGKQQITYEDLGFSEPVHSRHFSAIGASYHMPGTVIYTLSESGVIRRFESGKITFSTKDE